MGEFVRFKVQEGKQTEFFKKSDECLEVLYGGGKGAGKTFGVLGHFDRHQATFGDISGLLVRDTIESLKDIIKKATKMFCNPEDHNRAHYNKKDRLFTFPNGATLRLSYLEKYGNAEMYQGHAYEWICVDEAGVFPSEEPINHLRSCLRTEIEGCQRIMIFTANPSYGGSQWLRKKFVTPVPYGDIQECKDTIVNDKGEEVTTTFNRVYIHTTMEDNPVFLKSNDNYINTLHGLAKGDPARFRALAYGEWSAPKGGMFSDVWDSKIHLLPRFTVPLGWLVYRSFDEGYAKPFSVGYWAMSDGISPVTFSGGKSVLYPKGTMIRIYENYGNANDNNVGLNLVTEVFMKRLFKIEDELKAIYGIRNINCGGADPSIFRNVDGNSTALKHTSYGLHWKKLHVGRNTRTVIWSKLRELMYNSIVLHKEHTENPCFFITSDCSSFLRTVVEIERDKNNPDDVNTHSEDHVLDETGYMIRYLDSSVSVSRVLI